MLNLCQNNFTFGKKNYSRKQAKPWQMKKIRKNLKKLISLKNKFKHMIFSIIIPTYNEEEYLPVLLDSIKEQSFDDYEIIVADANSTDKTREIAKSYGCIVVDGGLPAAGRNNGAKIAKGEYLLFIDGDDLLVNNILEKSYLKAKEKNIDIIQFQTYSGDFFKSFYCSNKKRKTC